MRLNIHKVENQRYCHKEEVLQFIFKVEFEQEAFIGDDLRANLFLLVSCSDEILQVGGSACITAIRKEEEIVGPNKPVQLHVNILEDNHGELVPGTYMLFGGVVGSVKLPTGFKAFELKSENLV